MADCTENIVTDSNTTGTAVGNLVGPKAMSHNVYNHILLSPTQVSRNLSIPLNQSSGLVGGKARIGDRVIENFHSVDSVPTSRAKADGHRFSPGSCIYEDCGKEVLRVEDPHNKPCSTISGNACSSPIQEVISINCIDNEEAIEMKSDLCEDAVEKNEVLDVGEFIKLHLKNSSEKTTNISQVPSPSEDGESKQASCSLSALQKLVQKTNDIIKNNRCLQQQIVSLKNETTLQTKVLTKLLKKKCKRLNNKSSTKTSA